MFLKVSNRITYCVVYFFNILFIKMCSKKMLETWKRQFTTRKFGFEHDNPRVFVESQWQPEKNVFNPYYLFYRCLVTTFFVVSLIFTVIDIPHLDQSASDRAKWLIYLTNWGFAACTLQSLLCTGMLLVCFIESKRCPEERISDRSYTGLKLWKVYWVTYQISIPIAFGISIIYWTLIYDSEKMFVDALNIIAHIMNSVFMLVELIVVAHPVRILHFYWPVLFGLSYCIFSIIYYVAGGLSREGTTYIYKIVDWSKPGMTALVCLLVLIFVIVLHCCVYCAYVLRKYIHGKLFKIQLDEERPSSPSEKTDTDAAYNNPVFNA